MPNNSPVTYSAPKGTLTEYGGLYLAKYPSNIGTPPYDKWILFEARKGRHVMRSSIVGGSENGAVDRTLGAVALYLPTTAMQSSLSVSYNQDDAGSTKGTIMDMIAKGGQALPGFAAASWKERMSKTLTGLKNVAGGALEAGGAEVLIRAESELGIEGKSTNLVGVKVNPRTDLFFDAVQYRTHTMEFIMVPRSLKEAMAIDKIIEFFYHYGLPNMGSSIIDGQDSAFIGIPYEFEITIVNGAKELDHTNKIARSVISNIQLDQSHGGRVAFTKSTINGKDDTEIYPASTALTLQFQEVMLLDRNSTAIQRNTGMTYEE